MCYNIYITTYGVIMTTFILNNSVGISIQYFKTLKEAELLKIEMENYHQEKYYITILKQK